MDTRSPARPAETVDGDTRRQEMARTVEALLRDGDAGAAPAAHGYQARVLVFPDHDPPLVIKLPRPGRWYYFSRWSIRREHRAYQRLAGVPGVPPCYGLFRGEWLVLGYIPGRKLRSRYLRTDHAGPHPAIPGLRATIADMHRRGVAHSDLKRHNNLILGTDGTLYVIDFGTAVLRRPGQRGSPLWRWAAQQDWNAWIRHGWGRRTERMPPAVKRLHRRTAIERMAAAGRRLYR